jgi:hypothetical protein
MPPSSKSTGRPSFYEVVFRGSPKVVRGFLAGLQVGCNQRSTILYHYDVGIYDESRSERLAERFGFKSADCHVIVDRALSQRLRKIAKILPDKTGLEISSCRHIRSAELPFEFKVYARRYRQEIMALIRGLPEGLRLVDFVDDEKIRPGAEGVEAYTPVHDYEACGQGTIIGRIDLLVAHRRKLARQPLIAEGMIRLKLA